MPTPRRYIEKLSWHRAAKLAPLNLSENGDRAIEILNYTEEELKVADRRGPGIKKRAVLIARKNRTEFFRGDIVGASCGIPHCYCAWAMTGAVIVPQAYVQSLIDAGRW